MASEPVLEVRNDALRMLSNGVYVLTTAVSDSVHGATVTWASQISVQPALVLVALRRNSHLVKAVRDAHRFVLNVLDTGQQPIAELFFQHQVAPLEAGEFSGHSFRTDPAHCPLLLDALAWVECRLASEAEAPGDHNLLIGEISGAGVRREGRAMVLADTPWMYGGFAPEIVS